MVARNTGAWRKILKKDSLTWIFEPEMIIECAYVCIICIYIYIHIYKILYEFLNLTYRSSTAR